MTTETQSAPVQDPPDEATQGYVLWHPRTGYEQCPLGVLQELDPKPSAIELYRSRDLAAAVRLANGWSDEARIVPVAIGHECPIASRNAIIELRKRFDRIGITLEALEDSDAKVEKALDQLALAELPLHDLERSVSDDEDAS